ncbi:YihY/virulence factor BrkB family protein [Streptococcus sp. E17BB]|uniref:YihY/virulence factor BrkB family protein n=1 Tax=Streptococcus sp. E17BB TaxID=3278714 RepID=UPI00359EC195
MLKERFQTLKAHPLVQKFISHYQSAEIDLSSIAVAYYLLLTLFPLLVLVANIFPYFNIDTADLLTFLREQLPKELYDIVAGLVENIFNQPLTGLVWLSLATGFWTMSRGFFFLQKAVNKAYDNSEEHRDFLLGRLIGLLSGVILIVFLALGIVLSTFGRSLLDLLHQRFALVTELYELLGTLLQPMVWLVFGIALLILYYLLPNIRITKKRYLLPGTLFTSFVLLTTTNLFGTYVSQTIMRMENLRFLGSVALFALMMWFILFSQVLIFGAVLNASYQAYREGELIPRRGTVKQLVTGQKE